MTIGILGTKVGMTQIFDESGFAIPVTVIKAGPCVRDCLAKIVPNPK